MCTAPWWSGYGGCQVIVVGVVDRCRESHLEEEKGKEKENIKVLFLRVVVKV